MWLASEKNTEKSEPGSTKVKRIFLHRNDYEISPTLPISLPKKKYVVVPPDFFDKRHALKTFFMTIANVDVLDTWRHGCSIIVSCVPVHDAPPLHRPFSNTTTYSTSYCPPKEHSIIIQPLEQHHFSKISSLDYLTLSLSRDRNPVSLVGSTTFPKKHVETSHRHRKRRRRRRWRCTGSAPMDGGGFLQVDDENDCVVVVVLTCCIIIATTTTNSSPQQHHNCHHSSLHRRWHSTKFTL